MSSPKRKAATRPAPRTVDVTMNGGGDFDGWWCKARADFPARVLEALNSGDLDRTLGAFAAIIVEHNFPDSDGNIAAELADVDPARALPIMAAEVFAAIGRLPNR